MDHPLMSDTHARVSAILWSGGDWCEMLAFGRTGGIPEDAHDLLHEIARQFAEAEGPARQALEDLAHYVGVVGARPAVANWESFWDPEFAELIR